MGGFFGGVGASVADMVGATSSVAGTAGLCPAPAAGDERKFLFGDATFKGNLFAPSVGPILKSSTRYYFPYGMVSRPEGTDTGNFNNTNGAILVPHVISGSDTISNIVFINHTANANTDLELGVFSSDINTGWPLTKITQVTTINLGSTAAGTMVTTAATASVSGLFWLCVYSRSSISAAIKAHSNEQTGNFLVMQTIGADTFNSVPRKRFVIKNSSISSNTFPSTLSTSDLEATTQTNSTPTLAVTY